MKYHNCALYDNTSFKPPNNNMTLHVIIFLVKVVKTKYFHSKNLDSFFFYFSSNIDRGYTLESPRRGGCKEYPRSMFWRKKIRKIGIPPQTPVLIYKSGVQRGIHYKVVSLMEACVRLKKFSKFWRMFVLRHRHTEHALQERIKR